MFKDILIKLTHAENISKISGVAVELPQTQFKIDC